MADRFINVEEDEKFNLLTEASKNLYGYARKPEKQEITMQLIIKRNLISKTSNPTLASPRKRETIEDDDINTVKSMKAEEQAEKLLKLTHVHLDRENIVAIDNLAEYLGPITNLYLQHNLIKKIENLEFLKNLRFLVLSNNQIEKIENLNQLSQLKFLDLSYNFIDEFDVDELPNSLMILDLRGNKCIDDYIWNKNNYQKRLASYMKNLQQLNGEQIKERFNETESSQDDENDDKYDNEDDESLDECDDINDDNFIKNINKDINRMHKIGENIIERSKLRQKEFEMKSQREFEVMKLQLENSKKELLDRIRQNNF